MATSEINPFLEATIACGHAIWSTPNASLKIGTSTLPVRTLRRQTRSFTSTRLVPYVVSLTPYVLKSRSLRLQVPLIKSSIPTHNVSKSDSLRFQATYACGHAIWVTLSASPNRNSYDYELEQYIHVTILYVFKHDPVCLQVRLLASSSPTPYGFQPDSLRRRVRLPSSSSPIPYVIESDSLRSRF